MSGYEYEKVNKTLVSAVSELPDEHVGELDEVYHKAEYYDRFMEDIKEYYSGVPLDLSLHDVVARHYFGKE